MGCDTNPTFVKEEIQHGHIYAKVYSLGWALRGTIVL